MLVHDLTVYYRQHLSDYELVYRHVHPRYRTILIVLIVLSLLGFASVLIWRRTPQVSSVLFYTASALTILMLLVNVFFECKACIVANSKFNIRSRSRLLLNRIGVDNIRSKLLKQYLRQQGLLTPNKLRVLIAELQRQSAIASLVPLITSVGVFATIIISFWLGLISQTSNESLKVGSFLVFILFIVALIGICVALTLRNLFRNLHVRPLECLLVDIYLSLPPRLTS